jgi:2-dehydro-3-deoxyphosphogluconate aldolase / (4S)-4-hydroxy-2-oxoglutarate aldolase
MSAREVIEHISRLKVVPVAVVEDPDDAPRIAEALFAGGLNCLEVVFRTKRAAEAIKRAGEQHGMLVGAGTVLSVDQVKRAVDNGASFVVSPGVDTDVVDYCVEHDICTIPGAATASEVQACLRRGITTVKFFPAEALGGLAHINALGAPFPQVRFVPTGGIGPANLADYLASPRIAAVGGSWLVKRDVVAAGDFDEITTRATQAAGLVSSMAT